MEINSRGSSSTREPTENASLIDNQEPIHVSVDDETQDQLQQGAAAAAATVADLVAVGDGPPPTIMEGGPPPDGPPPVYYPQGELPPPYHVAATLPTYEEAELIKEGKLDQSQIHREVIPGHIIGEDVPAEGMDRRPSGTLGFTRGVVRAGGAGIPRGFQFATALSFPAGLEDPEAAGGAGGGGVSDASAAAAQLLGNDFVFFTAFLTAFLFNWIGFLLLMCFCHTIAARYGALSGFGLSLAKWTLIVKNSTDFGTSENNWLWWLITAFGMLVCMRAVFQYLHIKRTWRHLSTAARERLFFFY